MSADLVERVARAIFVAVVGDDNGRWEEMEEYERADYRTEARAAIEAMREPTVKMQRAGFLALDTSRDCDCDQKDVWAAMIDAALEKDKRK